MQPSDYTTKTKGILAEIKSQRHEIKIKTDKISQSISALTKELEAKKSQDLGLMKIEVQLMGLLDGSDIEPQDPTPTDPQGTARSPKNYSRGPEILELMKSADQEWWTVAEMAAVREENEQLVRIAMDGMSRRGVLEKEQTEKVNGVVRVRFRVAR